MTKEIPKNEWYTFKNNVRTARKYFKVSQEKIANAIGCSRSNYQHFEAIGQGTWVPEIIEFWYKNYRITPNHLFIGNLDNEKLDIITKKRKPKTGRKKLIAKVKKPTVKPDGWQIQIT